jgi:hypothetical protein
MPTPFGTFVIAGKRGTVYLVADRPRGIGRELATLSGCAAYGGAAATGQVVVLPCTDGIRRLDVDVHEMRWRWRLAGAGGSPVIARDVVYLLDQSNGDLVEISLGDGAIRARVHVGDVTRFATPVPIARLVLVGTTTGVVAVAGR